MGAGCSHGLEDLDPKVFYKVSPRNSHQKNLFRSLSFEAGLFFFFFFCPTFCCESQVAGLAMCF